MPATTDQRCPRCDRAECQWWIARAIGFPSTDEDGVACQDNTVNWRTRCLAAQAMADQLADALSDCLAQAVESVSAEFAARVQAVIDEHAASRAARGEGANA